VHKRFYIHEWIHTVTDMTPRSSGRIRELSKDALLAHSARRAILEVLRQEPGLSPVRLRDQIGSSRNSLAYHLRVLERTGLVVVVRRGQRRHFFVRNEGFVNDDKQLVAALRQERSLVIARAVFDHPGVGHADLCRATGWSPGAVSWHLRRLTAAGVLDADGGARPRYNPGRAALRLDLSRFDLAREPSGIIQWHGDTAEPAIPV
jgi:predicted transcriptional regulator